MTTFQDAKVVIFLTYELFGLTILRFVQRSTDRRDLCIGNLGAITFKFWGTVKVKVHVNTFERTCLEHYVRVTENSKTGWRVDAQF